MIWTASPTAGDLPTNAVVGAVGTTQDIDHQRRITADQVGDITQIRLRGAQQPHRVGQGPGAGTRRSVFEIAARNCSFVMAVIGRYA